MNLKHSPLKSPYPPLASSAGGDWPAHGRCEFRVLLAAITLRAFTPCVVTMPSAHFCCEIKASCDAFSHDSATCADLPHAITVEYARHT